MTAAPPTTLADWLLARIAEDEADPWIWNELEVYGAGRVVGQAEHDAVDRVRDACTNRVLAECEAKRQIVTRYEFARDQADSHAVNRSEDAGWEKIAGALELCCRSLALPYADHDGYRDEWRL